MAPDIPLFFEDRLMWREWLDKNHKKASEVWILAYKTHTGKKCLSYSDALDEALCYGWIDCRMRRIDDEKHMWRFAPRKPDSIWSMRNRASAERLIKEGRMTPHGMAKIEAGKRSGEWDKAYSPSRPPRMPKDLKDALMRDELARRNFQALARSYRHAYIAWVVSAKRDETRRKRILEVVKRARKNIRSIVG